MTSGSNGVGEATTAAPSHYGGVVERAGLLDPRRRMAAYAASAALALVAIALRRWMDVLGPGIVPFDLGEQITVNGIVDREFGRMEVYARDAVRADGSKVTFSHQYE